MKKIYIIISLFVLITIQGCYLTESLDTDTSSSKELVRNVTGTWYIKSMNITAKKLGNGNMVTYTNNNVGTLIISRIKKYNSSNDLFGFIYSANTNLKVPQLNSSYTYPDVYKQIYISYTSSNNYTSRAYAVPYNFIEPVNGSSTFTVLSSGELKMSWLNYDTDEKGEMLLSK